MSQNLYLIHVHFHKLLYTNMFSIPDIFPKTIHQKNVKYEVFNGDGYEHYSPYGCNTLQSGKQVLC
jgi:hypothetical protein